MYSWSSVSQADTVFFEFDTEMISSTVLIVQGALALSSHLFIMSSFPEIDSSLHFFAAFWYRSYAGHVFINQALYRTKTVYTLAM